MREGHAVLALWCAVAAASMTLAAPPPVEFSGVIVENGRPKIALTEKATDTLQWVTPGEDFLGYQVDRYDAHEAAVFLRKAGEEFRVALALPKTPDDRRPGIAAQTTPPAAPPATPAAATPTTLEPVTANAIRNNLRNFVAAAQRYRAETGATNVSYRDVVGPGKYLADLTPIAGENYSMLTHTPGSTIVGITTASGATITLDTSTPAPALSAGTSVATAGTTGSAPSPAATVAPVGAAPAAPAARPVPDAGEALAPTGRQPASPSYMVRGGDTWETISRNTGVPVPQLKQLNPAILEGSPLPAGQTIKVR